MNSTELTNIIYPPRKCGRIPLRTALFFGALLLTLAALPFHELIANRVFELGTLSNDSPPPELVEDMIDTSPHSHQAILSAWNSGKAAHRDVSIFELRKWVSSNDCIPAEFQTLVQEAAFDPNLNVREIAFRVLRKCHDPNLGALAAAQLHDCDPEVRLLGAEYFRWISADVGVPTASLLLDDPDPRVVVTGLKLLERWTHQNFGVKLTEIAAGVYDEKTGLIEFRAGSQAKSKAGAERAKAWWTDHRAEFTSAAIMPTAPSPGTPPVPAADFETLTVDGHALRLSDFRGKTVLLYFWATPRPGCISELEDFMALQQKHGNQLAVIAVSVDTVVDDDGDLAGEDDDAGPHDRAYHHPPPLDQIRQNVARVVRDHGIAFPVIVDDHFAIGGKFDATEPPVTVVIDSLGFIRRQFTGRRRLPVLEAMVEEASQPSKALHK